MHREPSLRSAPSLQEIHATLRALYEREFPIGPPTPLSEILLRRLPEDIKTLIEQQPHFPTQKAILGIHLAIGRDAALSNERNAIAHRDTLPPIIAHELLTVATGEKSLTSLERMGCVFFDVDGTKTIVDCTSHAHVGKYLEELATYLCHPPAPVQQWLQERHLRTKAYAVAGDEFIVLAHSDSHLVDKKTLDALAIEVQKGIAQSTILASFVSFDDPAFIMEYDEWTDEARAAYRRDPAAMKERLRLSRNKLPDRFTPSVSCGSATFLEALQEALFPDTEEAKTIEELGVNAFHRMIGNADTRMKSEKRQFRENLKDPRLQAFLLRNAENRLLMNENEKLRQENHKLWNENEKLQQELTAIQHATRNAVQRTTGGTEEDSA